MFYKEIITLSFQKHLTDPLDLFPFTKQSLTFKDGEKVVYEHMSNQVSSIPFKTLTLVCYSSVASDFQVILTTE